MRPADLLPADTISLAESADTMTLEAKTRADNALTVLKNRRDALDGAIAAIEPPPAGPLNLTPIRDALRELADYGFAGVYPTSAKGDTEPLRVQFVAQGQSVLAQANKRIISADAATNALARVSAIFGRSLYSCRDSSLRVRAS